MSTTSPRRRCHHPARRPRPVVPASREHRETTERVSSAGRRTSRSCFAGSGGVPLRRLRVSRRNCWSSRATSLVGWERSHPRGGQLDRQRDPVEAPADLRDRPRLRRRQDEVRLGVAGTIAEQPNGVRRLQTIQVVTVGGHAERGDRDEVLTGERETFAARRENGDVGALSGDRVDRGATASRRCSQLSSKRINRLAARYSSTVASSGRAAVGCKRLGAIALHTASGSVTAANSHSQAPPGRSGAIAAATSRARRVLPTPPTPVSVTIGRSRTRVATRAISCSRPTNVVTWRGRLPGVVESDRGGGNPLRSCGCVSWKTHRLGEIAQMMLAEIGHIGLLW